MAKLMPVLFQGRPVSCSVLLPGAMSYQGPSSFPLLPPFFPDRQIFLATWKDIPNENEAQFQIRDCPLNAGRTPPSTLPLICIQPLSRH